MIIYSFGSYPFCIEFAGSSRARRTANVHHHPVQATVRESLVSSAADPIAELLSQLSGVRRSASSSSSSSSQQLQQLQMQLQLERQRQRGLHQYHSLAGVSTSASNGGHTSSGGVNSAGPSGLDGHGGAAAGAAAAAAAAVVSGGMIVNSSMGGVTSTSHPMSMGSHLWSNFSGGPSSSAAASAASAAAKSGGGAHGSSGSNTGSTGSGSFLLSQLSDEDQSDDSIDERKRRGFFVEELVLASLSGYGNTTAALTDQLHNPPPPRPSTRPSRPSLPVQHTSETEELDAQQPTTSTAESSGFTK